MRLDLDGQRGVLTGAAGDVIAAQVDLAEAANAWKLIIKKETLPMARRTSGDQKQPQIPLIV